MQFQDEQRCGLHGTLCRQLLSADIDESPRQRLPALRQVRVPAQKVNHQINSYIHATQHLYAVCFPGTPGNKLIHCFIYGDKYLMSVCLLSFMVLFNILI